MRMVPRKPEATRAGCSLICSPEHAILHDRLIHVVRGKGHTVTLTDPGPVIRVSKEVYRPQLVRHLIACYAASTAGESCFCRTAAGVWTPCRSMSQVVL